MVLLQHLALAPGPDLDPDLCSRPQAFTEAPRRVSYRIQGWAISKVLRIPPSEYLSTAAECPLPELLSEGSKLPKRETKSKETLHTHTYTIAITDRVKK